MAMPDNGRKQPRTHLFVAATLYSGERSIPVHIRNMSSSGALIESSAIAERGTKVVLKRGSLQVVGCVAWKLDRRAGLAFEATVCVADWMSRYPSAKQQRVDEIVAGFKTNSRSGSASVVDEDTSLAGSIVAELAALRSDLTELEAGLIKDIILVATHPEIQALDISLQRIDRLMTSLRSFGIC